jgi:hypothetical protein
MMQEETNPIVEMAKKSFLGCLEELKTCRIDSPEWDFYWGILAASKTYFEGTHRKRQEKLKADIALATLEEESRKLMSANILEAERKKRGKL